MDDIVEEQEGERRRWVGVVQYLNRSLDELAAEIEARDATIATLTRRLGELEIALAEMIYETTHLSPREDDGSHVCKISQGALQRAREALHTTPQGGDHG